MKNMNLIFRFIVAMMATVVFVASCTDEAPVEPEEMKWEGDAAAAKRVSSNIVLSDGTVVVVKTTPPPPDTTSTENDGGSDDGTDPDATEPDGTGDGTEGDGSDNTENDGSDDGTGSDDGGTDDSSDDGTDDDGDEPYVPELSDQERWILKKMDKGFTRSEALRLWEAKQNGNYAEVYHEITTGNSGGSDDGSSNGGGSSSRSTEGNGDGGGGGSGSSDDGGSDDGPPEVPEPKFTVVEPDDPPLIALQSNHDGGPTCTGTYDCCRPGPIDYSDPCLEYCPEADEYRRVGGSQNPCIHSCDTSNTPPEWAIGIRVDYKDASLYWSGYDCQRLVRDVEAACGKTGNFNEARCFSLGELACSGDRGNIACYEYGELISDEALARRHNSVFDPDGNVKTDWRANLETLYASDLMRESLGFCGGVRSPSPCSSSEIVKLTYDDKNGNGEWDSGEEVTGREYSPNIRYELGQVCLYNSPSTPGVVSKECYSVP